MKLLFLVSLCLLNNNVKTQRTVELLKNADFESTSFSSNWKCSGCTMTSTTSDKYHGSRSILVSHRHSESSVPKQVVNVTGGQTYVARTYIKLQNLPHGKYYTQVDFVAAYLLHGRTKFESFASIPMQQTKFGWTELSGDILIPSGISSVTLYVRVRDANVDYLLDYSSLQQLPKNVHWKSDANKRINAIRKANVSFKLAPGTTTNGIYIEIIQEKVAFPFGTAVNAHYITDPAYKNYLNFIDKKFNWVVLANALKWKVMEHVKGRIDLLTPGNAIAVLKSKGKKIRGHCMFWDVEKHSPQWLHGKTSTEYITEMKKHVTDVISHTKGKLEHWDVNNENLHGQYYEQQTSDPDITSKMFQWIHSANPGVKLFLNEYHAVSSSSRTTALRNQGLQFRNNSAPIYGIGIQSHFYSTDIDMDVIKYRLDKLAESGLKLWITELTVNSKDQNKKADALENLMTMFYSHPAVEGIMLWGFWDGSIWHDDEALFMGPNITANAAGQRYLDLTQKAWKTHFIHNLDPASHGFHKSVFTGDYLMNVKRNGHVIHQERFTVGPKGKQLTIHLSGRLYPSLDLSMLLHIGFQPMIPVVAVINR